MIPVEFVCLANSYKHRGRCVAGLRMDGKGWIRPVSDSADGVLVPPSYMLADHTEARLLDVVRVPLMTPQPRGHQQENWLLGPGKWKLVGRPAPESAIPILRANLWTEDILFGNPGDRVGADEIRTSERSLALLEPLDVQWQIKDAFEGRRQTRAWFRLGRQHYDLAITDPCWKNRLLRLDFGIYPRSEAALDATDRLLFTASLGEDMNGYYFKLIAGVTVLPASWRTLL